MTSSRRTLGLLCAASALLALVSCGGGGTDPQGIPFGPGNLGGGGGGELFPAGNVVGTVTSANDASPLASAGVSSGANATQSLSNGRWGLTLGNAPRTITHVRAANFADNYRVFAVAGLPVNVPSPLVPVGNATAITIAAGGTAAQTDTPGQITLGANALVPPTGVTAAAAVDVRLTQLSFLQNLNVVPGDFTALDAMSNVVPIETFGVVFVTATDTTGARYAMAAGQTAALRVPAITRGVPLPATAVFMYFDETNGRWIQTASAATLNGAFYEGTVNRLGFWAVAQPQPVFTLTGCVRDPADQPVANARVILEGVDYNAQSIGLTLADGTFTVPMRGNRAATVTAQAGGAVSNTVALTAQQTAGNFNLTPCLRTSGSANGLSIKLTWGAAPSDLDSHLFVPNGTHVYYFARGSLAAAPFAALDVDDVTGFGPEVITVTRLYPGTYRYAVYNFSGTFSPGMTGSGARVEVTRAGFTTTYAPPGGEGSSRWWVLFEMVVDSQCRVTIRSLQQWSASQPTVPATSSQPCS